MFPRVAGPCGRRVGIRIVSYIGIAPGCQLSDVTKPGVIDDTPLRRATVPQGLREQVSQMDRRGGGGSNFKRKQTQPSNSSERFAPLCRNNTRRMAQRVCGVGQPAKLRCEYLERVCAVVDSLGAVANLRRKPAAVCRGLPSRSRKQPDTPNGSYYTPQKALIVHPKRLLRSV